MVRQTAGGNVRVNKEGNYIGVLQPAGVEPPFCPFIDFHLYKSAIEEQTNSPELSALSMAQINLSFAPLCKANNVRGGL